MTITEPATLATDYLLAMATLFFAGGLACRARGEGKTSVRLWAAAFLASAMAALLGGTFHGFRLHFGPLAAAVLWKGTVYAVGLAGLLLLAGTIRAVIAGRWRRLLLTAAVLEFLFYAAWMAVHDDFRYVIYDYAPALLAVLLLALWSWLRRRDPAAPAIVAGILLSFAAAGIQAGRVDLHPRFNHNDLYHLVQLAAFYLLYRGGRRLTDRREPEK